MPKSARKHTRPGESGSPYQWVPKDPSRATAAAAPSGAGAVAERDRKRQKEDQPSLAEFRSEWPPLPDEASASNKDYYFNSYAHFGIHEDMLKDQVRTGCYQRAILGCKQLFQGKTVLDVGSGTGILCLFAAQAGATRVIGVECSDIVDHARVIAEQNGKADVVTFVRGKVEEVELPVDEVDIIISEWMGYFLIFESMLDSVLFARDKWLRKGGHLFPDHARLHVAAIEDADYKEEKIGFWSHVWGFDFSPMQQMVIQEPLSDIVDESAIATSTSCLIELDLRTCRREDLDFYASFSLQAKRKDFLHALVVWFDVSFRAASPQVVLSTAPGKPHTHWKQTVLYLDQPIVAHQGDIVSGHLAVRKSEHNPRDLDVKVSVDFSGAVAYTSRVQGYRLR